MRGAILILAFAIAGAGQTYPGKPFNIGAGDLQCAARMIAADEVQTWCYQKTYWPDGTPLSWKLVRNTRGIIREGFAIIDGIVAGPDQVMWLVNHLRPGDIRYQAVGNLDSSKYQEGILAEIRGKGFPDLPVVAKVCAYLCCASGIPIPYVSFVAATSSTCP